MTAMFALYAVMSITLLDSFQPYDFNCVLHRPNGTELQVQVFMRGREADRRIASVRSSSGLPQGSRIPVRMHWGANEVLDQETFSMQSGGLTYNYILDRSLPFEGRAIGLTVLAVDIASNEPVKLSAMGFCTVTNIDEEVANQ